MCVATYVSKKALKKTRERFRLSAEIREFYRLLLEDMVPVVRNRADGKPEAVTLKWCAQQELGGKPWSSFNVRGERIKQNRLWSEAYGAQHCLIPCDGYFDRESEQKEKRYHYFTRHDDEPLGLAGLWKIYHGVEILTIVTTAPNADVAGIHDRMPLTLPAHTWDAWLDARNTAALAPLIRPPADGQLKHWRVTDDLFKRTVPNTPELLTPIINSNTTEQTELF